MDEYFNVVVLPIIPKLQDVDFDCGVTSLKIILDTLKRDVDMKELMKYCTEGDNGVSPQVLVSAMTKMNVKYEEMVNSSIEKLQKKLCDLNLCLVDYQAWGKSGSDYKYLYAGHYSVVFGFNDTHFFIADPGKTSTPKHKVTNCVRKVRKDLFLKHWIDQEPDGTKYEKWMVAVPLCQ